MLKWNRTAQGLNIGKRLPMFHNIWIYDVVPDSITPISSKSLKFFVACGRRYTIGNSWTLFFTKIGRFKLGTLTNDGFRCFTKGLLKCAGDSQLFQTGRAIFETPFPFKQKHHHLSCNHYLLERAVSTKIIVIISVYVIKSPFKCTAARRFPSYTFNSFFPVLAESTFAADFFVFYFSA